MTARKTPPRRVAPSRVVVSTPQIPAGRLAELMRETNLPAPYVIAEGLVIAPPTKERADKIRDAQMVVMIYTQLLNEALGRASTEDVLNGLTKYIKEAERAYNENFFGDAYADVISFFATQPDSLWQAFEKDVQKAFFPSQPVDGKCGTCGHVIDEDAAGKVPPSSPSSSTGGTS